MRNLKNQALVSQIHDELGLLNGFSNPHHSSDFIVASEEENLFLVKENSEEAELAICLQKDLLHRLEDLKIPDDFQWEAIGDLSIVIEELSHFQLYCQRALSDTKLSALELEVQAEVDKFGLFLEWLKTKNEEQFVDRLFETLFGDLKLGSWVKKEETARYSEAHQIARAFCRRFIERLHAGESGPKDFRDFFFLSPDKKLTTRF